MTVTTTTARTPVRSAVRKRKAPVAPSFKEPQAHAEPAATNPQRPTVANTGPHRPTEHNGKKVVREELLYALPRAPLKITRLILEDDSVAYACRDCLFTADTRGLVMVHRNREHGMRLAGRKKKLDEPMRTAPDIVLPPREDGTPAPSRPEDWTIRELLAVMPDIAAFGDLVDRLETENAELRKMLDETTTVSRTDQHKIDVYESMQSELVGLRIWKKDVIKKFAALGFKMEEE